MRKVLVLEDEENIRSFVVINLKRAGYQTVEAGTGEEALEAVRNNSDIKVALLDIMLPGIDGFEVCRRLRAMDNKIGIIMLTARTQEMDKVTGLMTGADDYVTKPFSPAAPAGTRPPSPPTRSATRPFCSTPATAPWKKTASGSSSPRWNTPSSSCLWKTPARPCPERRFWIPSGARTTSAS